MAEQIFCVYFQKDGDGSQKDLADPTKPKRLFLFDKDTDPVWTQINPGEDMEALLDYSVNEANTVCAMMLIPLSACEKDEDGMLSKITFPEEFTNIG